MAKGKGEPKGWITKNGVHIPIYGDYTVRGGVEPKVKGSKFKSVGSKRKKVDTSTTMGKTTKQLEDKLKEKGLVLESADKADMAHKDFNDEKVTLYDNDGNVYRGTYNRYQNGDKEIVNIERDRSAEKVQSGQVEGKSGSSVKKGHTEEGKEYKWNPHRVDDIKNETLTNIDKLNPKITEGKWYEDEDYANYKKPFYEHGEEALHNASQRDFGKEYSELNDVERGQVLRGLDVDTARKEASIIASGDTPHHIKRMDYSSDDKGAVKDVEKVGTTKLTEEQAPRFKNADFGKEQASSKTDKAAVVNKYMKDNPWAAKMADDQFKSGRKYQDIQNDMYDAATSITNRKRATPEEHEQATNYLKNNLKKTPKLVAPTPEMLKQLGIDPKTYGTHNLDAAKEAQERYKKSANYADQKNMVYQQNAKKAKERDQALANEILAKALGGSDAVSRIAAGEHTVDIQTDGSKKAIAKAKRDINKAAAANDVRYGISENKRKGVVTGSRLNEGGGTFDTAIRNMSVSGLKQAYNTATGSEKSAIRQKLRSLGYTFVGGKWVKGK